MQAEATEKKQWPVNITYNYILHQQSFSFDWHFLPTLKCPFLNPYSRLTLTCKRTSVNWILEAFLSFDQTVKSFKINADQELHF